MDITMKNVVTKGCKYKRLCIWHSRSNANEYNAKNVKRGCKYKGGMCKMLIDAMMLRTLKVTLNIIMYRTVKLVDKYILLF